MPVTNCEACNELRTDAPEFATNGVTTAVCESLHKNTGFNPNLSVLHDNEEDLHNANDCLIGNLASEIDAYEVCDWKEFMNKLLPNLYETLKAIICSGSGMWGKVDNMCDTVKTLIDIGNEVTDVVKQDYLNPKVTVDGSSTIPPQIDSLFTLKEAYNCDGTRMKLQLYGFFMQGGYRMDGVVNGDLIASWNKSTLVPDHVSERTWNSLKTVTFNDILCTVNENTLVMGRCHVVDEKLCLYVDSIIGAAEATGKCETVQPNVRTRQLS